MRRDALPPRFRLAGVAYLLVAAAAARGARVIHVDADATGFVRDGAAWCSAYSDLQEGLAAALPGDEIRVANGVYRPDGATGDRTATFRLKSNVALTGSYAGCGAAYPDVRDVVLYATILSGDLNGDDGPDFANYADNSLHVVTYNDPNATGVVLDGFTVTSGNADGSDALTNQGGGIHIRDGTVPCLPGGPTIRNCLIEKNWGAHHGAVNDHGSSTTIENCVIRNNYAGMEGGGLQVHSGAPTITRCVFENNESGGDGGGAWIGGDDTPGCSGSSNPTFTDCDFRNNRALRGAGLFLDGLWFDPGTITIKESSLRANSAIGKGGAIYSARVTLNLSDILVEDNSAGQGGAIYSLYTAFRVRASGFRRNMSSSDGGGAMYSDFLQEPSLFVRCTFEANQAAVAGGAFATYGAVNNPPEFIQFINCRFVANRAGTIGGATHRGTELPKTAFTNCLLVGNLAPRAGAIGHDATLRNCTVVQNTASERHGAVEGVIEATNCIFWGNSDPYGVSHFPDGASVKFSTIEGLPADRQLDGNISDTPLFVDANGDDGKRGTVDDDLQLQPASPCAEAGSNEDIPADFADLDEDGDMAEPVPFDLAGNPRVVKVAVDMGAYEQADCNGNGAYDGDDIADGTSTDCNGNGIPDECDPDDDADGVPDSCDQCPGANDAVDCNGNDYPDACEIADGAAEDDDGNGIPDACDLMPSVSADGCRALVVSPQSGPDAVALRVTSPLYPCLDGFLQPDGMLADAPVFRTPDEWGTLVVLGAQIVPSAEYAIQADYGNGVLSAHARLTTAEWGDVVGMSAGSPPDGQVNVVDITAVINCFRDLPTAPPLHRCDLQPAVPDGVINVNDVTAAVDGFRGLPYPHGGPCP